MSGRRSGLLGALQTPAGTFALSVVGGGATAGIAGYGLGPAWNAYAHCRGASPGGCAAHPFWGFSPELYLLACLVGVVSGAVVVVVGFFASHGRFRPRPAGELLVALSVVGLLAYGGYGVGAAAGVAAGAVLIASRSSRPSAPSEWSGSFPAGVPPAPRGARKTMGGRPPVTEWDGIVASAPYGPPGTGRGRVALPQADRLAAALERSRIASPHAGVGPASPPPVVVLPPPPLGLRTSFRQASMPTGAVSAPAPPAARAPREIPAPVFGIPPSAPTSSSSAWRPEPAEVAPWSSTSSSGAAPAAAPAAAPRSTVTEGERAAPALPPTSGRPTRTLAASPRPGARPLREFVPPPPLTAAPAGAPAPAPGPAPRTAPPAPAPAPPPPSGGIPATPTGWPSPPPRAPPPAVPPARAPPAPVPAAPPTPMPPVPVLVPTSDERPPQPSGPQAKTRVRAWKCPNCGLVNAPWSDRCTGCKLAAPSFD